MIIKIIIVVIIIIVMIIMLIKDMYCANEPMNMIKQALHTNLMAYKQKHVKSKKKTSTSLNFQRSLHGCKKKTNFEMSFQLNFNMSKNIILVKQKEK